MASHIRYDQGEATRLKLLCIGRVKVRQIGQKILLCLPPALRIDRIGQKPCFFCGPCLPDHISTPGRSRLGRASCKSQYVRNASDCQMRMVSRRLARLTAARIAAMRCFRSTCLVG